MPPSRCVVTMAGVSSMVTVHLPSVACSTTSSTMASAKPRERRARQAPIPRRRMMAPSVPAR